MEQRLNMGGIVLAGGRSQRMGLDKAQLPWKGRTTLLVHAQDTLHAAVAGQVFVSRPFGAPRIYPNDLPDRWSQRGPGSGVWSGLHYSLHSMVAVLAVDLPEVPPQLYLWLSRHWVPGVAGVFPTYGPYRQPLAGLWSAHLAGPLAKMLASHPKPPALHKWLERWPVIWVTIPQRQWFFNLNTREDWITWRR